MYKKFRASVPKERDLVHSGVLAVCVLSRITAVTGLCHGKRSRYTSWPLSMEAGSSLQQRQPKAASVKTSALTTRPSKFCA
jgi:hypothetical protein